jgi:hypothetical protein
MLRAAMTLNRKPDPANAAKNDSGVSFAVEVKWAKHVANRPARTQRRRIPPLRRQRREVIGQRQPLGMDRGPNSGCGHGCLLE